MIFSNGFGLRFDILYAFSMVCATQPCAVSKSGI